ncbi:unnamed protein product [Clonostachys solani]|uniref:Zn(2)-C6 fungal-type domain-containing protein n=1 Tax=Clonostachys solani TaxID=160281 RepID=A0A9N9ZAN7_9HYPO|nr:unnamed protein product [Clonostachys solani]
MDSITPGEGPSPMATPQDSTRRKIRKGTRSCWECKRRKIRCIFPSQDGTICNGCLRRRVPCVTQEMPEDLVPATTRSGGQQLGERIARVEDFIKGFLANPHAAAISQAPRQEWQSGSDDSRAQANDSPVSAQLVPFPLTPVQSLRGESVPESVLVPDSRVGWNGLGSETAVHHLLGAFPKGEDARILLRESSKPSLYTQIMNTQPHSKLTYEALATPVAVPALPGPHSHPVSLARILFLFAITLQTPYSEKLRSLSEPQNTLMSRFVTTATTWVTTREEMSGTIDYLYCVMLEGVYEVNCGNLRRAWAVYRRAMAAAQLMGLHRSPTPSPKRIDPALDADPKFMWFRIIYMDRYLSLLLGLPQGTPDTSIGASSVLSREPPLGRFERSLTVIASRVLERNEGEFSSDGIATTHAIDAELLMVSKSMPGSFWRPVNFLNLTPASPDTLLETLRLSAQVYYYALLIQLHLPHMMRIGDNNQHEENSKFTCMNAGREIVTRFIAHRTFNPMSSCSRPVDFFALLAAMTLLLAHIDAHHGSEANHFLAHQRLGDLSMLNQALERMDILSNANNDAVSGKNARLIRRLLAIEADAAEGVDYATSSVNGDDDADDIDRQDDQTGGEALHLRIPYIGIVRIARQGPISRQPLLGQATSQQPIMQLRASEYERPVMYSNSGSENLTLQQTDLGSSEIDEADEWAFQGVDMALFDRLMGGTACMDGVRFD